MIRETYENYDLETKVSIINLNLDRVNEELMIKKALNLKDWIFQKNAFGIFPRANVHSYFLAPASTILRTEENAKLKNLVYNVLSGTYAKKTPLGNFYRGDKKES